MLCNGVIVFDELDEMLDASLVVPEHGRRRQTWGVSPMDDRYAVTVAAGALRSGSEGPVRFPHRWTPEGVTVDGAFTGAHLLHMAIAGCVLNDLYREAVAMGIDLRGVRVTAGGGFDTDTWTSTGITYAVEISSDAPDDQLARLLATVDEVAEIPRAVRTGAPVHRTP